MLDASLLGALEIFERGGVLMPVLLLLSVIAMATALLKLYQFHRYALRRLDFINPAVAMIRSGDTEAALKVLAGTHNPIARALEAGGLTLDASESGTPVDPKAEMIRVGNCQLRELGTWLRVLSSVTQVSPMLGLLGTVGGMISAFGKLEEAGSLANPALLSGGISAALLTTASGLVIAIPSMIALQYFEGEIDRVREAMQDAGARILSGIRTADGFVERGKRALQAVGHGA